MLLDANFYLKELEASIFVASVVMGCVIVTSSPDISRLLPTAIWSFESRRTTPVIGRVDACVRIPALTLKEPRDD